MALIFHFPSAIVFSISNWLKEGSNMHKKGDDRVSFDLCFIEHHAFLLHLKQVLVATESVASKGRQCPRLLMLAPSWMSHTCTCFASC